MTLARAPIGLFDSGVGGLTLVRALKKRLPNEQLIYLADTAHMPYGEKSPTTLRRYALANGQFLLKHHIKLLVIACHTASAHSLLFLQKHLPIPILGILDSGILALLSATKTGHVALLATPRTVSSQMYQNEIQRRAPQIHLTAIASPLLAPLAEEGLFRHPAAELLLPHYLSQMDLSQIDALLLGCTHFSLFGCILKRLLPPSVQLIDPAERCAETIHEHLQQRNLLAPLDHEPSPDQFFVSGDLAKFQTIASSILYSEQLVRPIFVMSHKSAKMLSCLKSDKN